MTIYALQQQTRAMPNRKELYRQLVSNLAHDSVYMVAYSLSMLSVFAHMT